MIRSAFILAVLGGAAVLPAQEANLTLRPQLNNSYRYEIKLESEDVATPQGSFALKITIVSSSTFTAATAESLTSKQKLESLKVNINGNDIDVPGGEAMNQEVELVMKPNGEIISRKAPAGMTRETPRYAAMTRMVLPSSPLKVGESFTREIKGDEKEKTVDAKSKLTFEGQETVGGVLANRMAFAYSEIVGDKPMGMVAKIWIEASTGMVVKMEGAMNDAVVNPMMPPMNMKMTMVRLAAE